MQTASSGQIVPVSTAASYRVEQVRYNSRLMAAVQCEGIYYVSGDQALSKDALEHSGHADEHREPRSANLRREYLVVLKGRLHS